MPTSKHRRKPGGKSVAHPDRGKPPPRVEVHVDRLQRTVARPFYRQFGNDHPAGFMLDLALEVLADAPGASRAGITAEFLQEENTAQQADEAWAFLVAQEIVTVDGDTVMLHPRFAAP